MGLSHSPSLVLPGLTLCLDAANTKSILSAVEVLVVAGGGGGGGGDVGSGGGAGGLIYSSVHSITPGSAITATVGDGGAGSSTYNIDGSNGGNSVFGALTAIGGGGGASWSSGTGQDGGSGGGGVGGSAGGLGTAGQGFAGGTGVGSPDYPQGGGGGAGGPGQTATNHTRAGDGGIGLSFPQFSSVGGSPSGWFAGGGGGGVEAGQNGSSVIPGNGGLGGGGNGGRQGGTAIIATAGSPNTGGGGGGTDPGTGGAGGSGIVIVRYPGSQRASGGTVTFVAGHTIHTFTTSGTFTPNGAPGTGTIWTDFSNNGNSGTLTNGPTYSSANGGSFVFDGSNDWFSTTLSIGDANTSFSWGGFVKVNSSTSSNFFLFGNYTENSTTPFFAITFNNSGDNTFIYIRDSTGGTEISSGSTNLDLSTWYYLMGVRDAGANQVKLYVNGELVDTDTFAGSHNVKSTTNNFGGVRHLTNYANCNIGTIHVYNRALTQAEIQQNYNALKSRYI